MTRACHTPVRMATGDAFTDEEIDDILQRLLRKAQRKGEAFDREAVEAAAAELTREEVLGRLTEQRLRLASRRASERFDAFVAAMGDVVGDEADRLRAFNVGSEKQGLGASFSVDAEARARTVALWGDVERGLREAGLLNRLSGFAVDEDFERAVARELSRLNGGKVEPTGDGDALKVAEILNAAQEKGRLMQNDAGAWIGRLEGYVTRQMHDRLRVAGGFWREFQTGGVGALGDFRGAALKASRRAFREWRDTIRPLLDDRTFEGIEARDLDDGFDDAARQLQANGAIDNADDVREVFLYRVWFDIVSGKSEALGGADDIGDFRPPASRARSASKSRVLHFTSPDAWMDYHQRFGRGSLLANVTATLERAARNTALMNRWGPAPEAMFQNKVSQLHAQARARGDTRAADRLMAAQRRAEFDEVAGLAQVPDNLRLAIIGRSIRLQQSLAKLGGMVLSGLSDTSLSASAMKRAGGSWLQGYGAAFAGVSRLQSAEGKAAADLLDVGARSAAAHLTGRFHAADGPLGWAASAQRFFYRVNLFEFWQDGLRRGVAEMLAAHLGAEARSPWAALNAGTRETLERYGLTADDWELARLGLIQPEARQPAPRSLRATASDRISADVSEPEGRRYWTFEAVDGISDRDLLRRAGLTGADATPEAARRLREDLRIRFQGMVQGVLDDAMTEARARERSGLTRGTRPGTVWGEAVRAFTQFWSFSAAILSRHIAPAVRGYAGQHPTALLAHVILASTAMGYLSLEAKQVTKGREPRLMGVLDDPAKWDELFVASLLQGGGMGIYGDWLFGEANRNGLGFTIGALGGPTISELERLTSIVNKAVSGDPDKIDDIPNDLINAAKANTPFLNLFYARTALDYLIFWRLQEAVRPGSVERYEKRIERETGSDFFVSPSESVR
jgi:hypothetical protein